MNGENNQNQEVARGTRKSGAFKLIVWALVLLVLILGTAWFIQKSKVAPLASSEELEITGIVSRVDNINKTFILEQAWLDKNEDGTFRRRGASFVIHWSSKTKFEPDFRSFSELSRVKVVLFSPESENNERGATAKRIEILD